MWENMVKLEFTFCVKMIFFFKPRERLLNFLSQIKINLQRTIISTSFIHKGIKKIKV